MTTPQQELQELARLFDERHRWWEQTVARAEKAKERHFVQFRKSHENLTAAEIYAIGLHRAAAIAAGKSKEPPYDLAQAYRSLRVFENEALDPLREIKPTGRLSNAYAEQWEKFAEFLRQGREWRAYDVLESMYGGRMRRSWNRIVHGHKKNDQDELRDEIDRGVSYIKRYQKKCDRMAKLRDEINDAENAIAKKIYKMLTDKSVQAMLRDDAAMRGAMTSRELAFLSRYAGSGFDMTEEDIKTDLSAQQGGLALAAIQKKMSAMAQDVPPVIRALRERSMLAGSRYDRAVSFARSAAVAHRLETKTSLLADGFHTDLRRELKTGRHMTDEDIRGLIGNAETKMRRWINLSHAQRSLDLVEQPEFDPAALPRMPWHSYTINAGLDSVRRATWDLPVKAFGKAVKTLGAAAVAIAGTIRNSFGQSSSGGGLAQQTARKIRNGNTATPPTPPTP